MRARSTALFLALVIAAMIAPAAAAAATITVNTAADVVANDSKCSLREAIRAANTDTESGLAPGECVAGTPGPNTIVLPAGDYVLSLGELDVSSPITLEGRGVADTTIDADGLSRLFGVLPGGSLTADHMTLIGGHAPDGRAGSSTTPGTDGGSGGAIENTGSLTLDDVTLAWNHAGDGGDGTSAQPPGAGGSGGAIESTGPLLTIADSTIAHSYAGTGGSASGGANGGPGGNGGAIDAAGGQITITASTIDKNSAGDGGSFAFVGGPAGNGGGLSLTNPAPLTLTNSTIAENNAGHTGADLPPAGSSSTGGALLLTGGSASLVQVTVAGNTEDDGVNFGHNIQTNGDVTISDSALDASCSSEVHDGGHNVALYNGGCPGRPANAQPGSPQFDLGPLSYNGGLTATMLPSASSALIDEVPASGAGCLPTDQRGVIRPQGYACDAGSVERRTTKVKLRPQRLRFGPVHLGHARRNTVRLFYVDGEIPIDLGRARLAGKDARDFKLVGNRCRGRQLVPGESCRLVVSFRPSKPGRRASELGVMIQSLGRLTVRLIGRGFF